MGKREAGRGLSLWFTMIVEYHAVGSISTDRPRRYTVVSQAATCRGRESLQCSMVKCGSTLGVVLAPHMRGIQSDCSFSVLPWPKHSYRKYKNFVVKIFSWSIEATKIKNHEIKTYAHASMRYGVVPMKIFLFPTKISLRENFWIYGISKR